MREIEPIVLFRRWAALAMGVAALNWMLGALIVAGVLWVWIYAIANPPFGLAYVWFHTHWTGVQTNIGGHVISDELGFIEFAVTVILQSGLFAFVWCWIEAGKKARSIAPASWV